jgi:hypothetical protein
MPSASPKKSNNATTVGMKALVSVDLNRSGEKPENQNQNAKQSPPAAGDKIQKHNHLAASEKRDGSKNEKG